MAPSPVRSVRDALGGDVVGHGTSSGGEIPGHGRLSFVPREHLNGLAADAAKPLGGDSEAREARTTALLRGALEQQLFQVQDPAAGVDSLQLLMQMAGAGVAPTLATDSLVHHIAATQRKEGDWPNYGSARPPRRTADSNTPPKAFGCRRRSRTEGRVR